MTEAPPDVAAKLADWFADCKVCYSDICSASPDPHIHVHITFDIPQRDLIVARLRSPTLTTDPSDREAALREDWVLVPREPTEEMCNAATTCVAGWLNIKGTQVTVNREKARARYKAMLSAAPAPPIKRAEAIKRAEGEG